MTPQQHDLFHARRQFLGRAATGIGTAALSSLLPAAAAADPLPVAQPSVTQSLAHHFAPKAKSVIYLFMAGAPSHVDLFDYKPTLTRLNGTQIPQELMEGQRFAFMKEFPKVGGSPWRFIRGNGTGGMFSSLLPHTAAIANELAVVHTMHTDQFNHDPAVTFVNSGAALPGRPSAGSWVSYGLGSENRDLPAFIVLNSGEPGQPLQSRYWGSGFLPTTHQGVQLRSQGDPVLYVSNPEGFSTETRRRSLDAVRQLNHWQLETINDPEIRTRIEQYELAFRMQLSVPELVRISEEPKSMLDLYGADPSEASFANNCLLARRLVERGVRFVQLYHTGWDHHGFSTEQDLLSQLPRKARETDQASAALITDLKQRGLLEDTLVIWGGEFGRTPMVQSNLPATHMGRDHHPRAFTIWMAGGGVRPGTIYGATDDFGYNVTENPVHVHDFHATLLHCLGIDHKRLTYKFQGRDYRLTDVHGRVIHDLLS